MLCSGLLLMSAMILLPMLITQLFLVSLEGTIPLVILCFIMCNSTHKIIGCATLTRQDHTVAQTRELACTRAVIPEVINTGDL